MNYSTLLYCYKSYYGIWIRPFRNGRVMLCTCDNHASFRAENRLIVNRNIRGVWNSKQFQYQRRLVSRKNWSFCRGASGCHIAPFFFEKAFIMKHPDVKNAILAKKTKLDYFAKRLYIIPSFACNNNCYCCFQASERRKGVNNQIGDNLIKEIKDEIIPIVDQIIVSGGEPLFSSPGLELINLITTYYPKKKLIILTNGTLLHQFGLQKIIQRNITLAVSFYGMNKETYRQVTRTDNFDAMFRNVCDLVKAGYKNMTLCYLISSKSARDAEDFCNFIEKNKGVKGLLQNNHYEGRKHWKIMRLLENKYSHLSSRLKFNYRDETMLIKITRRLYNPWHSLKYFLWSC